MKSLVTNQVENFITLIQTGVTAWSEAAKIARTSSPKIPSGPTRLPNKTA